jgi:hypothetical protein
MGDFGEHLLFASLGTEHRGESGSEVIILLFAPHHERNSEGAFEI